VIATDRTLGGTPASAMPSLIPLPRKNLEVLYGGEFANVTGMMEIGAALRQSGNGARGIVGGSHPRGYGHVWNVVNQDGVIRFLDSQGTLVKPGGLGVHNFDQFSDFQFLLTAPGRK
jgi:filamentous hemagglutinin